MTRWVKAQAAASAAVLTAGVVAAVLVPASSGTLTLAGPRVLRLIQAAPASLATYPSLHLSVRMTLVAGGRTLTVDETGTTTPDGSAGTMRIDMPAGVGRVDLETVDHTIYAQVPSQNLTATGGKHWVALTLTDLPPTSGFQTGADAVGYFKLLPGATGPVTVVGHGTIAGVRTTHYRVTINLLQAIQKSPPQIVQPGSIDALRAAGVTTFPVDVWLDGQRFVRQTEARVSLRGVSVRTRVLVRGSTTPVRVTPPRASDIYPTTTVTDFARMALGR